MKRFLFKNYFFDPKMENVPNYVLLLCLYYHVVRFQQSCQKTYQDMTFFSDVPSQKGSEISKVVTCGKFGFYPIIPYPWIVAARKVKLFMCYQHFDHQSSLVSFINDFK